MRRMKFMITLSLSLVLFSLTEGAFAGVGDKCPGGSKVLEVIIVKGQGKYVRCSDGKIYLLTGGGIDGNTGKPGFTEADSDWETIKIAGEGKVVKPGGPGDVDVGIDGYFGTQFPDSKGSGTTNGEVVVDGGIRVSGSVKVCAEKCMKRWDGTSKRQVRKRKECLADCGVSISGGSDIDLDIGGSVGGGGRVIIGGDVDIDAGGGGGRSRRRSYRRGHDCDYAASEEECFGTDAYYEVSGRYGVGVDCPECMGQKQHWLSGLAEVMGAVSPSLAYFGSNAMWSNAYLGGQRAFADAQKYGYEQCRLQHQSYMDYLSTNQLPGLTPNNYQQLRCNNQGIGGFAGFGGGFMGNQFGGFGNPWMSAGFSPGFMGGMMGPYGSGIGSPYGLGGGLYGGIGLGGQGLGLGLGIGLGGGGLGGGIGGQCACFTAPCNCPNVGFGGNFGGMPGYGTGIGFNGNLGLGTGFGQPGFGTGFGQQGFGTGIGFNGGLGLGAGAGVMPWNNGGGSYWGTTGGWGGNGYGFGQGWNNPWAMQQAYYGRQQANMIGSQYQQQGLMQNFYGAQQDLYGGMYQQGYGSAPYFPGNLGFSLSAGYNLGGGFN